MYSLFSGTSIEEAKAKIWKKRLNSSFSFKSTEANSYRGKEFNKFRCDNLCLCLCLQLHPLSMGTSLTILKSKLHVKTLTSCISYILVCTVHYSCTVICGKICRAQSWYPQCFLKIQASSKHGAWPTGRLLKLRGVHKL